MSSVAFPRAHRPLGLLGVGLLLLFASPPVGAQKKPVEPAKGMFLVAKPRVPGTFEESVVLLLAHTKEDGSLGVIINRSSEATLEDALPDLKVKDGPVHQLYFGGPVALNTLLVVFRTPNPPPGSVPVMADVYFSAEQEVLENLVKRKKPANEMHIFIGYAGWGPGQLQWEIRRGDWEVVRGDRESVFEKEPELIWPELMGPVTQQVAD